MNNLPVFYQKSNHTAKSLNKGFTAKFLHPRVRHEDFLELIAGYNKKKLLTAMGVINGIVYAAARERGAIFKGKDGRQCINSGRLNQFITRGCNYLKTSIQGLQVYLKKHWIVAPCHRIAIRAVRDDLHALKLIKAVKNRCRDAGRPWSVFLDIDIAGLLRLYEMMEDALLNYWGYPYDCLPAHRGGLIKKLYNAAKDFMGKLYRRILPEGAVGRDVWGGYIYRHDCPIDESVNEPNKPEKQEESPLCPTNPNPPNLTATLPIHSAPYSISDIQDWHNPTSREGTLRIADQ